MVAHRSARKVLTVLAALLAASSTAFAQSAAPPAPAPTVRADSAAAKPAPPPSPVSGIRGKISAGDLLSAESILDVYREKYGEDIRYCLGLGWLARGALLLGDHQKARRYSAELRARCADSLASGAKFEDDGDLPVALGACIEVDAQLVQQEKGAQAAAAALKAELDRLQGPVSLRSRVHKRLNIISMAGTRAPELEIEDWIGAKPPTLASLKGKPVMIYVWAEGCGDSRAQVASVARVASRHAADDLKVVALTRYYEKTAENRPKEKARADSVWQADYAKIGAAVPVVISTASMERYGGSSTPSFVFVDRQGVVRSYTPTRLTDAELERHLATILK